jgi:glycerate 2-kinase
MLAPRASKKRWDSWRARCSAAGALVTGATVPDATSAGLDAAEHLARHESHLFFEALGANIYTGPTGTNVNDVAVAMVY